MGKAVYNLFFQVLYLGYENRCLLLDMLRNYVLFLEELGGELWLHLLKQAGSDFVSSPQLLKNGTCICQISMSS